MRKFRKSLAVVLLSASLVAVASCAKANNGGDPAPVHDIIDPFLKGTDVFIGDTVTITPREVTDEDGKIYPCYDFYTITPDGNRLSGEKQFISVAGKYETVFMAKKEDGSFITDSDSFIAYEKAFNVENENSSTQYTDKILGDFEHTTPGITATLVEGDTWHYNQIIDISGSSLAKPIIKFYSSPMSEYLNGDVAPFIDANKQVLRISDYYDPTNYIDVQIGYFLANQGTGRMQTYAVAGGASQSATGCMANSTPWGTRRLVTIDGIDYSCCFGFDDFGATMNTTPGWKSNRHPEESTDPTKPYFKPDITNSDGYGYSVYYVEETKRIYIQHRDLIFVTDLDEAKIYNDNVFKGFTTGEVTLSLHFDGYQSSKATFEVTEIFGKKGEELKEMKAMDDKAPIINIDCPEKNLYIARNEEFTVPTATARDAHLKGDVIKEVIFEKGSAFEKYIPLVNNKFTPADIGEYTIVYTAKDAFDNVSTKEIKCQAVNCTDDKLVSFSYTKIKDNIEAGEQVTFKAPTVSSPNDKGLFANITIVAPDGEETKFNALEGDVSYLLKRVGKYKVMYQYGDVAKSYTESYEFDTRASNKVFLETTVFPSYIIKNAKMSLEDNKAVLCDSADVHYVDTKLEVTWDGKTNWEEVPDINNFVAGGSVDRLVKFRYSYNNQVIYTTDDIPVVNVGFGGTLNLSNYFFNDDWTRELTTQSIQLSTSTSNSKLDFVNSLSFSNFSINFSFLSGTKFDKFKMVLTDYYEPSNVIEFEFAYQGASLYLRVLDQIIDLGVTDSINLTYDYVSSSIYYSTSSFFRLDNPFINDRFYLGFEFDSPSENAGVNLTKLLGQQFRSSITKDTTKPLLTSNKLSGYYSKGEEINIHQTYACDVLSPYLRENHTLIVQYQTEIGAPVEIVKSIDGVALDGSEDADRDYNIALSKEGLYIAKYKYVDQSNNFYELQDALHVVDDKAPVITIEGATSSTIDTCGLNANVKVRNATVEDEGECTLTIYAVSPNGAMTKVTNNTFKANVKGLWKVLYYAVDSVGNIGTNYYQVNCQ